MLSSPLSIPGRVSPAWESISWFCSRAAECVADQVSLSPFPVAWFSLCLLGISTPAALGYFRECRRGSASEMALRRKQHHAVQRRDLQTVRLSRQEALLEVKGL